MSKKPNEIARDSTNKIVRQHQIKEGAIFTQWDDNNFTVHYENHDEIFFLDYLYYVKETDYEFYPQYKLFMECIAQHAYYMDYHNARIRGFLPPLPPPVAKPKDYSNKRKGTVQIAESNG